ncbi:MAG: SBBP repeat-containing protein [Aphanothece sp. CMT-3BRIN-NPC111]|nr:SBBP repeat-containing protein [Aphanothece sp. CMT-3BRIN-NPC111]
MNICKLSVFLLSATTLLGTLSAPVQAQSVSWSKQLGTANIDSSSGVATDSNGNAYITGSTNGSLGGVNQGLFDAWVGKYDSSGTQLWKKQLGTANRDDAYDVATDSNANVYITGSTRGSLAAVNPTPGNEDAWVAKYNSSGTQLWKKQLSTSSYEMSKGVATDSNGNVYITGFTGGSLAAPNQGWSDAWVAKYNSSGTLLWKKQLGTSSLEGASDVAVDNNGNVYISGSTLISGLVGNDAWIAKYNSSGTFLWKKQVTTANNTDDSSVATDSNGNLYISSSTNGSFAGPNQGQNDAWVAKYNSSGTELWKRQLGTSVNDLSNHIAIDKNGLVYITGGTYGSLGGANQGNEDAWVAKYNTLGTFLWKKQLGTSNRDSSRGVAIGINNSLYLSGYTEGSLGGANQGSSDAWIAKYTGI